MFKFLKEILFPKSEKESGNNEKKLQIATCALFIEIAKADNSFSEVEREKILALMKDKFNLEEQYASELLELSEKKADESVSIYEFTKVINSNFSKQEKLELLSNLWRLIYADDILSKYEESLVKKIGILLNVEYTDIISAKIFVKNELKK